MGTTSIVPIFAISAPRFGCHHSLNPREGQGGNGFRDSSNLPLSQYLIYLRLRHSLGPCTDIYFTFSRGQMVLQICMEVVGFIMHHVANAVPTEASALWFLVISSCVQLACSLLVQMPVPIVTRRNATPILILSKYYISLATACSWAFKVVQLPYATGTLFCNRFMQPLLQLMGIFVQPPYATLMQPATLERKSLNRAMFPLANPWGEPAKGSPSSACSWIPVPCSGRACGMPSV